MTDDRIAVVTALLEGHRDYSTGLLARRIIEALDQRAVYTKWEGPRKQALIEAQGYWIPHSDLLEYLNSLPGEPLTMADLKARMQKPEPEYSFVGAFSDGDVEEQAECLRVYRREKKAGTEFKAIFAAIDDALQPSRDRRGEDEYNAKMQKKQAFFDGYLADSNRDFGFMTKPGGGGPRYARRAGQLYRLVHAGLNEWQVLRINSIDDDGEPVNQTFRTVTAATDYIDEAGYGIPTRRSRTRNAKMESWRRVIR